MIERRTNGRALADMAARMDRAKWARLAADAPRTAALEARMDRAGVHSLAALAAVEAR